MCYIMLEQVSNVVSVIPAGTIQISSSGEGGQGIQTLTMTNAAASGAIVQYAQGQEFYVPGLFVVLIERGDLCKYYGFSCCAKW